MKKMSLDVVPALPSLASAERRGSALHKNPLGQDDVLSLNIASGCVHRCAFCSVRAYPAYQGNETVKLYADNVSRLHRELDARLHKPRAVYVSPSTDPFPPMMAVQKETIHVVEALAEHNVDALLATRGFIRPFALAKLAKLRDRVRVTVAMITLDRALQRTLEPLTAPPRLRLRQIARLRSLDIPVRVALDPLLPNLTDTRENLMPIFEALSGLGVHQVTVGYAFLRSAIQQELARVLKPLGKDQAVFKAYEGGPIQEVGRIAAARYLPRQLRNRRYAAIMAWASEFDVRIQISALHNPDFTAPRDTTEPSQQRLLPMFLNQPGLSLRERFGSVST